jgi:hypothetical protein
MENAPVIMIGGNEFIKPEYQERYGKWVMEVYYPLLAKIPQFEGIDRYQMVNEKSGYPKNISLYQCNSFVSFEEVEKNSIYTSIMRDWKTTFVDTGRMELFWRALYELMRSFRSADFSPTSGQNTQSENGPILHFEGYRLFPDEEEKYSGWVSKWGFEFYFPALMRLPGIKKYNLYKLLDYKFLEWMRPKGTGVHPAYLSALYFDSVEAYQNYENSIEVAAMRQALKEHFDRDLEFKWSVQYQQILSMQK